MLKWFVLIACIELLFLAPAQAGSQGPLVILHMNVGQGDATLIIAPSGETILFDGGDRSTGRDVVTSRLRTLGYNKLDYVIASHYDADHIGGLDDVGLLMTSAPRAVHDRREAAPLGLKETATYTKYKTVYAEKRNQPMRLGPGLFELESDVKILITSGNGCVYQKGYVANKALDENASSLSLVLNYGNFDYFIGGDLTGGGQSGTRKTADIETGTAAIVGAVDVLRLNHHGSETSSNTTFLETLDPKVAIISVGNGGSNASRYHHPRRSVLTRLHALSNMGALRKVYLTNRGETDGGLQQQDQNLLEVVDGDIAVVTNGNWFLVNGVAWQADARTSGASRLASGVSETCAATNER